MMNWFLAGILRYNIVTRKRVSFKLQFATELLKMKFN